MADDTVVAVVKAGKADYPKGPFSPTKVYPEFGRLGAYRMETQKDNGVYGAVRLALKQLGLDRKNFGKAGWNPLKGFVKTGDKVVIKPNLVFDRHPLKEKGLEAMVTHASVVRPIVDYVLLATGGKCKITICDVPLQSARWEPMVEDCGLEALVEFYKSKGVDVALLDLRKEIALQNEEGVVFERVRRERDPRGYAVVELGRRGHIYNVVKDYERLEITDYGIGTVSKHHNQQKNEYLVPKTILEADVFINVPKMKTHKKAGVTLSMKNLIGINGDKSWIAHHRRGVDEYPSFQLKTYLKWNLSNSLKLYAPAWLVTLVYKTYRIVFTRGKSAQERTMEYGGSLMEGNWYGNDTVWRTIVDLNNIIMFADKSGKIRETRQRNYLTIIDGIVGMDKEGPMDGRPKKSGMIVAGFHPVATDFATAYLMGFDYRKIPSIREGFWEKYFGLTKFGPEDVAIISNIDFEKTNLHFTPSKGWVNHVERT